jgi:diguanylate cyclase (GGDEF)-like protein
VTNDSSNYRISFGRGKRPWRIIANKEAKYGRYFSPLIRNADPTNRVLEESAVLPICKINGPSSLTAAGLQRGQMISLKKYLDSLSPNLNVSGGAEILTTADALHPKDPTRVLAMAVAAYRAALREMGSCSVEVCPSLGRDLKDSLIKLDERLERDSSAAAVAFAEVAVQEQLQAWGRRTAEHYRQKTEEVKDLLLAMARAAESVGERDQRAAGQISEVTARLHAIASLDDLAEIRKSIERSTADLRISVDRMASEGKQAIAELRAELTSYQAKLEETEELASRDGLTGLRNRVWVERQIDRRLSPGKTFSVAIVDIDEFKSVNDSYGHLAGDELLQQFAAELKSACRSTDMLGRWGGDEFILVFDCALPEAQGQIERLRVWTCGNYKVHSKAGQVKLHVEASMGLAERQAGESMKDLLARADAAMYLCKGASKAAGAAARSRAS